MLDQAAQLSASERLIDPLRDRIAWLEQRLAAEVRLARKAPLRLRLAGEIATLAWPDASGPESFPAPSHA